MKFKSDNQRKAVMSSIGQRGGVKKNMVSPARFGGKKFETAKTIAAAMSKECPACGSTEIHSVKKDSHRMDVCRGCGLFMGEKY